MASNNDGQTVELDKNLNLHHYLLESCDMVGIQACPVEVNIVFNQQTSSRLVEI